VTFANAGSYRVVVTNPAGAVVSAPAKLVVKEGAGVAKTGV
jgi:hypothetical protein